MLLSKLLVLFKLKAATAGSNATIRLIRTLMHEPRSITACLPNNDPATSAHYFYILFQKGMDMPR